MSSRVLMIGLDGASPALVERWQADLPNLGRLMGKGAWGTLRSTRPHYTLPAWPSMLTGVHPGKLGFFGFQRRLPGSYQLTFNSIRNSPAPAVWDVLGCIGRRSGLIGVPGTFPPQAINGFLVAGFPSPANDGRLTFTYPAELSRRLDERFQRYEIQVYHSYKPGEEEAFARACQRVAEIQWEAAEWLASTQSWDFLAVVSLTIDRASHYFWRFMDPDHPLYDSRDADRWGSLLHDFYCREDAHLGRLLEQVDDQDLVLVTSDHGFTGRYRVVYLNQWLQQRGYLHLEQQVLQADWLGKLAAPLVRLYQRNRAVRTLLAPLHRTAARDRLLAAHHAHQHGRLRLDMAPVAWDETRAYALNQNRLYLNLQGREPQGQVAPDDYESTLKQLEAELHGLRDRDGHLIPVRLRRGRELYEGSFVEQGPDLLIYFDDYHCDLATGVGGDQITGPSGRLSGTHHPDGLVIIHGPGVRPGTRLEADIVDVAPTILHALDAPVPNHCDGRPIRGAFTEDSAFNGRPVDYAEGFRKTTDDRQWSEEEEEEMMRQLRDLGYV